MFFDMWVQILSCDCGALNTAEKAILQSPFSILPRRADASPVQLRRSENELVTVKIAKSNAFLQYILFIKGFLKFWTILHLYFPGKHE